MKSESGNTTGYACCKSERNKGLEMDANDNKSTAVGNQECTRIPNRITTGHQQYMVI
jgi:hypothetical protein